VCPDSENDLATDDAWISCRSLVRQKAWLMMATPPDIVPEIKRATTRGCDAKERQKSQGVTFPCRSTRSAVSEPVERQVCPSKASTRPAFSTLGPASNVA